MISVITGDLINSRKSDPAGWLRLLKRELSLTGKSPSDWEIYAGDTFQLRVDDPREAMRVAFRFKSAFRSVKPLDVRLAIGIGEMTYKSKRITECNGPAFVASGESYGLLKKEKRSLAVRSPWPAFDEEVNLCLRLGLLVMDHWTENAAEIVRLALSHPEASQSELGERLGIRQNSVSTRLARARFGEVMEIEEFYRKNLSSLL